MSKQLKEMVKPVENKDLPHPPRLKICVTTHEIATAMPANSGHCMIADAVKVATEKKYKRKMACVSVDLQTIRFSDLERRLKFIYLTPSLVQRALLQFDQGIQVTPFNFRLSSGQTIAMKPVNKVPKQTSEKQKEASRKALAKSHAISADKQGKKKNQPVLSVTKGSGGNGTSLHKNIKGGKAPPKAVLSGNRRQFGVRAAGSLDGPTQ